jgi:hypothetical protein
MMKLSGFQSAMIATAGNSYNVFMNVTLELG